MATTPLFGNGNDDNYDRATDRYGTQPLPEPNATQPLSNPRVTRFLSGYGEAAPPTRQLSTLRQTQPMLPESPEGQTAGTRDIYETPTLVDLSQLDTATMLRPELHEETRRGYLAMALEHENTARVLRAQAYDIDEDVASMQHQCAGLSQDFDHLDAAVRRGVPFAPRWQKHYQWLAAAIPAMLQDIARYRNQAQSKLSRARDHEAAAAQLRLLAQQGA